jgi:hypothetical protein
MFQNGNTTYVDKQVTVDVIIQKTDPNSKNRENNGYYHSVLQREKG